MASVTPQTQPQPQPHPNTPAEIYIFSHSNFFYWWPVWATGYIIAALTWLYGVDVPIPPGSDAIHSYKFLAYREAGVVFTLVFFLVILLTNVSMKGLWSAVVILLAVLAIVLMAYFNVWGTFLDWFGRLYIFMNLGFYVFFSTAVFVVWLVSFFIYDRMSYWKITPGQVTHQHVVGAAERSYDSRGMVFEKNQQDMFRHWILGLGSGDLHIVAHGAKSESMNIPNVLFVDSKVRRIQELISVHQQERVDPT